MAKAISVLEMIDGDFFLDGWVHSEVIGLEVLFQLERKDLDLVLFGGLGAHLKAGLKCE